LIAAFLTRAARHRALLAALFLLVLPFLLPFRATAVNVLIDGLFAVGFNLVYGYVGLLSFGHAALFGGGAYATGLALLRLGLPWYGALALGLVAGAGIAGVIGLLATRTRGIYFAMVTLALAECVYYLAYQASGVTGGENGLRGIVLTKIDLFGLDLDFVDPLTRYFVIATIVALALAALSRILASPFGAVMEMVRENEARARASGVDVRAVRVLAFVLSGAFSGLAGGLQALHLAIVPIETLDYGNSGMVVMMCLLGGAGTFFGPFIGALVFLLLQNLVALVSSHWQLPVGVVFMACVLFLPRGIWGQLARWRPA
jgi:branched-chain amino acid transport system permease protein